MLPAAIWPYIMGLCAVLAVAAWAGRDLSASRSLCAVLVALVAIRAASYVYGDSSAYTALAALIWAVTAMHVFRSIGATASSILVLSALCYFWANYSGAPRVVGSLPFVVSDVLLVAAIVWIGSSGICAFYQRTLNLGRSGDRHCDCAAGLSHEVAANPPP